MSLKNRVVIVTGGSRGIGREVARTFLYEGARVIIFAREQTALKEAQKELSSFGNVDVFQVDVSQYKNVEEKVEQVVAQHSSPTVLVNVAGIHGAIGFLPKTEPEKWKAAIEVNLLGTFNMLHVVLPYMIRQGHGKIINFSGGGAVSPRPYFSAYAASKAGVVKLTETLATELLNNNISVDVNAIAPGPINTRLLDEMLKAGEEKVGKGEYQKLLQQKTEGGASIQNVARLCLFLASSNSDGLSGKLISAVHDDWQSISGHVEEIMNSDIYSVRRIRKNF